MRHAIPLSRPGFPIDQPAARAEPRTSDCLRCQFLGRRRLLCSKADACRSLPIVFPVGPLLLAAWLGTAIAFYFAVR